MEATTINSLFDARNRRFSIPAYQRAYSWSEKQINQFIEDLKKTSNQYYLGHFLFEKGSDDNKFLIIDGQQRLTTCVIFFSAMINELFKRKDEITIDLISLRDLYLKDHGSPKLETVWYDNNYFENAIIDSKDILCDVNSQSQLLIHKAKVLFETEFEKTDTAELERWCNLVQKARITQFIVEDKIQAAQIFAFQNDRGKGLSKIEILKSFFMLQIYLSSDNIEQTERSISFLEREFATIYQRMVNIIAKEDDVLSYFWRSIVGYSSEDVVQEVKDKLGEIERGSQIEWIKTYISGLSKAFNTVQYVENSTLSNIQNLRYLNNMALSYPFLIKAWALSVSDKTFDRLCSFLENITFRVLLCGGRASIESRLNSFLVNMDSDVSVNQAINAMINELKTNWKWSDYWGDRQMNDWLSDGYFYGNRVDNYLLWRYELSLANADYENPHISFDELISNESIEHIAPQTPSDGKPIENGYGIYDDKDNPELGIVSGGWLNCVGNLMLISQSHNSSIRNKPFSDKLASYGKDNFLHQQREIRSFVSDESNPVWDKDAIERRYKKILDAATKIWNLDNI